MSMSSFAPVSRLAVQRMIELCQRWSRLARPSLTEIISVRSESLRAGCHSTREGKDVAANQVSPLFEISESPHSTFAGLPVGLAGLRGHIETKTTVAFIVPILATLRSASERL